MPRFIPRLLERAPARLANPHLVKNPFAVAFGPAAAFAKTWLKEWLWIRFVEIDHVGHPFLSAFLPFAVSS
jgi:hypothetical protein